MRLRVPRRSVLAGALLALGCYSPTLPLPPPVKPDISQAETGEYRLRGGVYPDAQVFALNGRNLLIDGQQADHLGEYDFLLRGAQAGDSISLWYQEGQDLSPTTDFVLPDLSGGARGASAGSGGSGAQGGSGGAGAGGAGAGG